MPGITGIIRREPYQGIRRDVELMTKAMRHESFYTGNQYADEDCGLYFGWQAHPDSLGSCMPLISRDKQLLIVIVGEHFPGFCTVRTSNGMRLSEESEDNLLHLYEESEDKFLRFLNGWFCGVAVDRRVGRVTVFNDRYGMGRIYWHEAGDEFLFGSEAKSILRVRPQLRSIEPRALAQYLGFNCVMGNESLFKDISLLPGGSAWTFAAGGVSQRRKYFEFSEWEQQPNLATGEFFQKFGETVSSVFPAYALGTEEVGLSLTAGLDTRLILAAASESGRKFPCYTFGGLWGETFDIRTARKLAKVSDDTHQIIRIDEGFLKEFPEYARKSVYISDGTHDAHGAHDVYFNRMAREIAPIRLTGKFGSEVVRTRKLIPRMNFPRHLLRPDLVPFLDEASSLRHSIERPHPLSRVVGDEIAWYEYGRVAVEQSALVLRTPFMDNSLVKLMFQAGAEIRATRDLQSSFVIDRSRPLAAISTNLGIIGKDRSLRNKLNYLPLWALFKIEYIYLYATPHWITWLDRRLEKLRLERIITGRQKFEGYRIWFKTHFADYIRDMLLSPNAECTNFFDKKWIDRIVTGHLAGTHNYFFEINKMLTVELICSSLIAQSRLPDVPTLLSSQDASYSGARVAPRTH